MYNFTHACARTHTHKQTQVNLTVVHGALVLCTGVSWLALADEAGCLGVAELLPLQLGQALVVLQQRALETLAPVVARLQGTLIHIHLAVLAFIAFTKQTHPSTGWVRVRRTCMLRSIFKGDLLSFSTFMTYKRCYND